MSQLVKKQKIGLHILHYWHGIPGRGEYVRLAFEYTKTPYIDCAAKDNATLIPTIKDPKKVGSPTHFAPPCLELPNGRFISQTPAILGYLAPKFGLDGTKDVEDEDDKEITRAHVNQLVSTALDLTSEAHDVHHPVNIEAYYEDQKPEAEKKAKTFRSSRIPKFLKHFESVLSSNAKNGANAGPYLVSGSTTIADLVLFHTITGLDFAFPKRMKAIRESGEYDLVFKLFDRVEAEPSIDSYLKSDRRQKFSMGIFRHYPELDAEE